MILQILLFITSIFVLAWLSSKLISTLVEIARYLRWREFIVGFFIMAFATSLPNMFVDINAALQGFPQLSFGDVLGGNLADLTIVMALAVLFSKKGISTKSKMVQKSAIFTIIIAILPLVLILDGAVNRVDGIILLATFFIYFFWIFSKEDNFQKTYSDKKSSADIKSPFWLLKNFFKFIFLLGLLLFASYIIIDIAKFFSAALGASMALVGVAIVGLGNSFPETYFSIISARKGGGWMILGNLMGAVIVCSTLVLGIVALISPFTIADFSPYFIARIFLLIAVAFYLFAIRSDKKISKVEGLCLLIIYIAFLLAEIFLPKVG